MCVWWRWYGAVVLSILAAMWRCLKLLGDVPFISTPLPMLIAHFLPRCDLRVDGAYGGTDRPYYEAQGKDVIKCVHV